MKILPDEIPSDAAPLTTPTIDNRLREPITSGKNMFVSLLDGRTLVGRVESIKRTRDGATYFTVGQSDPIDSNLVETAREV